MKTNLLLCLAILLLPAAAFAVSPSICGPNADISYHPNGNLKCCSNTDQSYSQGDFSCNASSQICFFSGGQVSQCTLKGTYRVGDIACGESGTIQFYTSGALQTCTLKSDTVIQGRKCMGSQPVYLFENGSLSSCSVQGF